MASEMFHYFVRISSALFPSAEQGASALFELLPDVTQVEIVGDQFGTYRYVVPMSISTSQGVETILAEAGIAADVQAVPPLDPSTTDSSENHDGSRANERHAGRSPQPHPI